MIEVGNVYWMKSKSKFHHPHVIIAIDAETLTLCQLTTNMSKLNFPGNVPIPLGEANLRKQSIVEVTKTVSASKQELGEFIGQLSEQRVEQIRAGIEFVRKSFLS